MKKVKISGVAGNYAGEESAGGEIGVDDRDRVGSLVRKPEVDCASPIRGNSDVAIRGKRGLEGNGLAFDGKIAGLGGEFGGGSGQSEGALAVDDGDGAFVGSGFGGIFVKQVGIGAIGGGGDAEAFAGLWSAASGDGQVEIFVLKEVFSGDLDVAAGDVA